MAFAVSLRRSRWWLYTKAYILGAMVSLFTATPVSSRIPSAPAQIQQQLTRLQALRENVQREETRFREALSRAGISTASPGQPQQPLSSGQTPQDGDIDLEQGLGTGTPASPLSPSSKPWAIERALESLGERAQAEARQRQQQHILREPLVESPQSEPELVPYHHADRTRSFRLRRQRSSTAPPAPFADCRPSGTASAAGNVSPATATFFVSRTQAILKRWANRFQDLRNIRRLMSRDEAARNLYPEVDWDAQVRRGNELNPLEIKFLEARIKRISSPASTLSSSETARSQKKGQKLGEEGSLSVQTRVPAGGNLSKHTDDEGLSPLHRFLGLPATEKIHPDDVPVVSLGGSGGGYRAKFGFAAFIAALEAGNAWQILSYVAGVSGSCWTIAELYTHAHLSPSVLLEHYKRVAAELAHPLSLKALNIVASTRHGVYFLLAPLLRKAQSGVVGLGIMDLYATMTTCYQFLPRSTANLAPSVRTAPQASMSQNSLVSNEENLRGAEGTETTPTTMQVNGTPAALSRTTFQWSKTLSRADLLPTDIAFGNGGAKSSSIGQGGAHPLPLLTAVRVSYADPNPSFLTRKAGVGRRAPIEDDFEREEFPHYKAQNAESAQEEQEVQPSQLPGPTREATREPRRNSVALLERHLAQAISSSPYQSDTVRRLTRVQSDPRSERTVQESASALDLELRRDRGGLPHPYDELLERGHARTRSGPGQQPSTPRTPFSVPPRLLSGLQPGPSRSAVTRSNAMGASENLTPQERLQRARALLVQSRRQRARAMAEQASSATGLGVAFQWFEISPIEVGSSDVGAWVPTWSFGRTFLSGRSLSRQPEASLSLLLGQCTSAPAGPLTGYIAALLASLPAGWTLAASLLGWINAFVRAKRWERRWGNPIRAADEPNPFYGLNISHETAVAPPQPIAPSAQAQNSEHCHFGATTSGAQPSIPRRAMVRGRGTSGLYEPRTGPRSQRPLHKSAQDTLHAPSGVEHHHRKITYTHPPSISISSDLKVIRDVTTGIAEKRNSLDRTDAMKAQDTSSCATKGSLNVPPRAMVRGRGLAQIYDPQAGPDPHFLPPPASSEPFKDEQQLSGSLWTWEANGRIKLMDSGLSNNLPSHVLMHPGRSVDIIIAFDASSDVQKGAAVQRIHEFGRDRGLRFRLRSEASGRDRAGSESSDQGDATARTARDESGSQHSCDAGETSSGVVSQATEQAPGAFPHLRARSEGSRTFVHRSRSESIDQAKDPANAAEQIRSKFSDKYAQVLDGWRVRTSCDPSHGLSEDWVDVEEEEAMFSREPDVRMIYCPLLPSAHIPDFDPSTSAFSTSYNLVWTPEQVETLVQCTKHNATNYAIDTIRQVVREVYESKKRRRLAEAAGFTL